MFHTNPPDHSIPTHLHHFQIYPQTFTSRPTYYLQSRRNLMASDGLVRSWSMNRRYTSCNPRHEIGKQIGTNQIFERIPVARWMMTESLGMDKQLFTNTSRAGRLRHLSISRRKWECSSILENVLSHRSWHAQCVSLAMRWNVKYWVALPWDAQAGARRCTGYECRLIIVLCRCECGRWMRWVVRMRIVDDMSRSIKAYDSWTRLYAIG